VINVLPLTIESLVSILLLLTILYCVRLNNQLKRLKAGGTSMQQTIAELITATETAERAIAGLKATVREADETLGERLRSAEKFSAEMRRNATAGAEVLNRLTQIAGARLMQTEPEPEEDPSPPPDARSIGAAAQALAERARARARAIAACHGGCASFV
jgi:chromosome segregation ATPase